jgi:hypothetical protein
MFRLKIFLMILIFFACKGKTLKEGDPEYDYEHFSKLFKNASLPYQLSDTSLINNKDTTTIRIQSFSALITDSIGKKNLGKGVKIKYIPLWKYQTNDNYYFIVKAEGAHKKAALLIILNKNHQLVASFPFLIPDSDATTMQVSSIDKTFSISKTVLQKRSNNVNAEGKDVYVYDKDAKKFVLVMTDPLDERQVEIVNPIDTLPRHHKLAGDYLKDKRNIVSIRDGRRPNLLTVFVHIETDNDCNGEIKGEAIITSPTSAIYQQAGDPCGLKLNFKGSSVSLTEQGACGSRRGLDCRFEGSFVKKKATKPRQKKSVGASSNK